MSLEAEHRKFMESLSPKQYLEAMASQIVSLEELSRTRVTNVLIGQVTRSRLEDSLMGTYHRMSAWMSTLTRLRGVLDFQASCSAARSLFELLVDLRLLQLYGDEAAEKFFAFEWIERFRVGETIVRFNNDKYPQDTLRCCSQRRFITDPGNVTKYESLRKQLWNKERPSDKVEHWWGVNMFERCRIIDRQQADPSQYKFEESYRSMYSMASWYVHSGPTGVVDMSFDSLLSAFAWSLALGNNYFCEATEIIAKQFQLFEADPEFREKLKQAKETAGRILIESFLAAQEVEEKVTQESEKDYQ